MSETFTASNGWYIDECGDLWSSLGELVLLDSHIAHVRRFFLEERDHELGRWRDTVNPDYVVYPRGNGIVDVLRESQLGSVLGIGIERGITRSDVEGRRGDVASHFYDAARRYFEAHPQHKPLPTKPGVYANKELFRNRCSRTIELTPDGHWVQANTLKDVTELAQSWADADQLVRLVPESGADDV